MTSNRKSPSPTFRDSSPPVEDINLSSLPPVFVLSAHLSTEDLHDIEDQLQQHGALVTYDINEAKLVIGKVGTKKRAQFELRSRGLWTEEVGGKIEPINAQKLDGAEEPPRKKARLDSPKKERESAIITTLGGDSSTESEDESQNSMPNLVNDKSTANDGITQETSTALNNSSLGPEHDDQVEKGIGIIDRLRPVSKTKAREVPGLKQMNLFKNIQVLKLQWLEDSFHQSRVMDIGPYIIYEGCAVQSPPDYGRSTYKQNSFPIPAAAKLPNSQHKFAERPQTQKILERAQADLSGISQVAHYNPMSHGARRFERHGASSQFSHQDPTPHPAKLLEMTTSEYEGGDSDMPKAPEWVKKNLRYACQRSTPANPPNDAFIKEIKKIKLARLLIGDEIGVRAYSTFIAAIAAYPYTISNPREILRLPGCDVKLANLWIEWKNFGHIKEADDCENDETLQGLKLFYDIWGVGATTARTFYNDKGWRDTDDVIEYGWKDLNRVQQIGLKYYDEFKVGIPRTEVEIIASKVREHAVKVRDGGIELMVVGGYRRGKAESGDVDMIVSHRDLEKTAGLVNDIVASLETEGWITHTLTLSLTSTERGQSTLPFKSSGVASHGVGFDTLDKALVVWQDPSWSTMNLDLAENPQAKNPNIHRRVDIIISPWRTVGCAITGWSGGTTFQRDLRRYARAIKGWKFDSSGVRDRSTGEVVELEGPEGVSGDMLEAEKAIFQGLGLIYRPPTERCTD
jgi:DNA polymerase IV